jgi:hypothetical protein
MRSMDIGKHGKRREWVGGRVLPPFYVTEGGLRRPELILWLEMPEQVVVFFELTEPGADPGSFGASLVKAMESPLAGPPRRPSAVRVSDALLAAEVRRVLPEVPVEQAATPELDQALELLSAAAERDRPPARHSYFEDGRVGARAVADLFRSAKLLYHLAPWKVADDDRILRVDIPALGVEAACLSIIGALGENLGLILFPSLEGYQRFADGADEPADEGTPIDMGTSLLSLGFEAGSDLPPEMYREALEHGWPVADQRAYPIVRHVDRDGVLRPLTEADVRTASACAASLVAFFGKHADLFREDADGEPVCESYFDEEDLEVRFTLPYEARPHFPINSGAGPRPAAPDARPASGPAPSHALDAKLAERLSRYARKRFGTAWVASAATAFRNPGASRDFLGAWAFHHHDLEGKPVAQWFLEERADRLPGDELAWLKAQCSAWLSIWETVDVVPGRSLVLRDQLTGETRVVWETAASSSLRKRDAVLARVVDHAGLSVLCGLYPRSLPPRFADAVRERVRGRLRRRGRVPVDRLRGEPIGRYLIARWEEALEEADLLSRRPPRLTNSDGDPLLLTTDHFRLDAADRAAIQRRLQRVEGVEVECAEGDPGAVYVFSKPSGRVPGGWESTLTGRAVLSGEALTLETNSIRRADALRATLERALGPLVSHRAREHSDPLAALKAHRDAGDSFSEPPPSSEQEALLLEVKSRHYAGWLDQPRPALGGQTPRETVRSKAGRRQVDLLLREMENHEARVPAGQRFDFDPIRRELGLSEDVD